MSKGQSIGVVVLVLCVLALSCSSALATEIKYEWYELPNLTAEQLKELQVQTAAKSATSIEEFHATIAELSGTLGFLNLESAGLPTTGAEAQSWSVPYELNEYILTIIVAPLGGGFVTPDISPPYHYGDVVVLTESPNPGYTFSGWTGDGIGIGITRIVTMHGNMVVTAAFTQDMYTLAVSTVGNGVVNRNDSGPYNYGDWVQLTAVPDPAWAFSTWSGDLTGSNNPEDILIDGNKAVGATFTFTGIFGDGFESGDFSAWTGTDGTPTVSTDYAHHGTYSCKIDDKEGPYKDLGSNYATLWARVYVYFTSLPSYDDYRIGIIKIGNPTFWGYALFAEAYRNNGITYFSIIDAYSDIRVNSDLVVETGKWYCVEMKFSNINGVNCQLFVDGTLEAGLGSWNGGNANRVAVGDGAAGIGGGVAYIDCVVVSDTYIGPEV